LDFLVANSGYPAAFGEVSEELRVKSRVPVARSNATNALVTTNPNRQFEELERRSASASNT